VERAVRGTESRWAKHWRAAVGRETGRTRGEKRSGDAGPAREEGIRRPGRYWAGVSSWALGWLGEGFRFGVLFFYLYSISISFALLIQTPLEFKS
jgi:hypothetical protein